MMRAAAAATYAGGGRAPVWGGHARRAARACNQHAPPAAAWPSPPSQCLRQHGSTRIGTPLQLPSARRCDSTAAAGARRDADTPPAPGGAPTAAAAAAAGSRQPNVLGGLSVQPLEVPQSQDTAQREEEALPPVPPLRLWGGDAALMAGCARRGGGSSPHDRQTQHAMPPLARQGPPEQPQGGAPCPVPCFLQAPVPTPSTHPQPLPRPPAASPAAGCASQCSSAAASTAASRCSSCAPRATTRWPSTCRYAAALGPLL